MMTPTPTKQRKTTDFMASYLVTSKSISCSRSCLADRTGVGTSSVTRRDRAAFATNSRGEIPTAT